MARGIELLLLVAMLCTWQAAGARDSGSEAPNFALKALDGRNYRLSEMRGSVVLLSFGATWCGPCRSQLSTLQEFHERYHGAGLAVLGVNLDEHDREAADLSRGLGFPVLRDSRHDVSELYRLGRMPLIVLIDRDGIVRQVYEGRETPGADVVLAELRELLRE